MVITILTMTISAQRRAASTNRSTVASVSNRATTASVSYVIWSQIIMICCVTCVIYRWYNNAMSWVTHATYPCTVANTINGTR